MKTVMKSVYLVTALSLLTLSGHADPTSNQNNVNPQTNNESASTSSSTKSFNPLGNYQCQQEEGSNDTVYSLVVSKAGDTYTFEWDDSNGNPIFYGTGVMVESLPNAVAASFWDPKKPDAIGVEVFEVKSDGSLQGNWTLQSDNQVGTETCTKSKSTT